MPAPVPTQPPLARPRLHSPLELMIEVHSPAPTSLRPAPPTSAFEARLCLLIGRHVVPEPGTPPSHPHRLLPSLEAPPLPGLVCVHWAAADHRPRPSRRPAYSRRKGGGPLPRPQVSPASIGPAARPSEAPPLPEVRSVSRVGRKRSSRSRLPAAGPAPRGPAHLAPPPRDRPVRWAAGRRRRAMRGSGTRARANGAGPWE